MNRLLQRMIIWSLALLWTLALPVRSAQIKATERTGTTKDFLSMPSLPPTELHGIKASGKGVLRIHYRDGIIFQIDSLVSSGNPELDRVARQHVLKTFKVRPGASGVIQMPFDLRGDFAVMERMALPRPFRSHATKLNRSALVVVDYKNGEITRVELVHSTGNPDLDRALAAHVMLNYKLRPGVSGRALLPVGIKP